jgi:hypothetical protein
MESHSQEYTSEKIKIKYPIALGFDLLRFPSKSLPENKEQDDQHNQNDHGHVVPHQEIPHLLFHRFPVSPKGATHEDPDQIPRSAAQKGEKRYRNSSEAGYARSNRNDRANAGYESIEQDQEIPVTAEPLLSLDNVFCLKEFEISLNEKMPAQKSPKPEEGQETEQAPNGRGDVDSDETQLPHSYQESPESRDRVTGNGRHQVFHESAQSQKEVDQEVGKVSKFAQESFHGHLVNLSQGEIASRAEYLYLIALDSQRKKRLTGFWASVRRIKNPSKSDG